MSFPAHEPIHTVIFDLGNVLIDWNPRYLFRKLFGNDVAAMERFLNEVCHTEWNEKQDAGRSWDEAVEEAISRHPDHEEFIRAYHRRWSEMLGGPIEPTVELLRELRERDIRLLALTNWSHETFPVALQRYDFLGWFEDILVSGREKLIKPDPAIFRLLIERFKIDVPHAVFIDDSIRNVEGARRVGLRALHFTNARQLRADLASLGLKLT